ncbi:MAG: bifunctional oligoribonuclease/PAP phosphatase NrnA [Clostridia bacterium]|nr:bifunctional oligoribonuclease/PAP phosphatase NrnA [Clostridia bacterium]
MEIANNPNTLTTTQITAIRHLLQITENILITTHHNPDGDAIGSSMALFHTLNDAGIKSIVIVPNTIPESINWIERSDEIIVYDTQDSEEMTRLFDDAGLIFCLDFNDFKRVGDGMQKPLEASPAIKILIDHHPQPEVDAFDYLYSDTSASSTAELVYKFLQLLQMDDHIHKAAAESLYTGIITDTGSFSFSCNKPDIYLITADLIKRGVDAELLHRRIFDTFSEKRLRLMGYAFDQKLIILDSFHTAIIWLAKEELERFDHKPGDTEGIVNYPLSISTINVSILLTERDNLIRLSFRSKGDFAVNKLARDHFDGGGHHNAAGGNSELTMHETIEKIKSVLPLYQDELQYQI